MDSRYITIYPLRKKSDVLNAFTRYVQDINMSSGTKIKVLRSDNRGAYRSAGMDRLAHKICQSEASIPLVLQILAQLNDCAIHLV